MRVRMTAQISGSRNGTPWPPRGQPIDLPDAEAREYCKSGLAVPVADIKRAETAVPPAVDVETRADPGPAPASGPVQRRSALTKAKGPAAP
jgi:hypothetical protein